MAVATPCLQFRHSPTTMSSMCTLTPATNDVVLFFQSTFLGSCSSSSSCKLYKAHSKQRTSVRRACSASFENSSLNDEEFAKRIEELSFKFQFSGENFTGEIDGGEEEKIEMREEENELETKFQSSLMEIQSVEMKAKSLDLPLSLRMIKRKKKKENQIESKGNVYYCSVKKAFSSMVFIIRELHSYTLQMREILFYEDLQGIISRVQSEMHASFVWLFQQVFYHTPTLMIYIMILLANFTVDSVSNSAAIAATLQSPVATIEHQREIKIKGQNDQFNFESKSFTITSSSSSSSGKTTAVDGNNGGGDNVRPVGSGMDGGDGRLNDNGSSVLHRPIVSDGVYTWRTEEVEEEMKLWKEVVEEASRMRGNNEILPRFDAPVTAKIEVDEEYEDYFKTELVYQSGLAKEPNNVLLLANYAQFLYLVVHDFDRAEDYFKRAVKVEPKDAEAYNKYANFLWQARNDLWAAEETFLEAISADPSNSYYAANYAHFLWNTGGEDTCFPLDSPDDETLDS